MTPGCGNGTLVMTLLRNHSMPRSSARSFTPVGIATGIDRAAHQRHRQRNIGIVIGFHHRDGSHHRHRRLANRDHMHIAAEHVQHLDDVVDIVLEVEAAVGDRHHARIGPVGDVDFMRRQEGFHRAAQQRRVVAGHRRHDQHARGRLGQRPGQLTVEMQQAAKRLFPHGADLNGDADAVDQGIVEPPFRLAVTARGALEQLASRGNRFAELGVGPGIERI